MGGTSWRRWKYLAGVGVCLLFAWIAFVRKAQVPLLSLVDLGFHELGHLVTRPLPEIVMIAAGSFAQIAVPVGLAVYIADAPYQRLQLIGGEHDWAAILGPEHFNALGRAGAIAAAVRWFGIALLFVAFAVCVWTIVLDDAPAATADHGPRRADHGWGCSGDPGEQRLSTSTRPASGQGSGGL